MNHQKMTQYCKEQLHHQQTSSPPTQLTQQVVTNRGDKTAPKRRFKHLITGRQPDRLVAMVYKSTIHQIPQTSEMDQHASDVENKAT